MVCVWTGGFILEQNEFLPVGNSDRFVLEKGKLKNRDANFQFAKEDLDKRCWLWLKVKRSEP